MFCASQRPISKRPICQTCLDEYSKRRQDHAHQLTERSPSGARDDLSVKDDGNPCQEPSARRILLEVPDPPFLEPRKGRHKRSKSHVPRLF